MEKQFRKYTDFTQMFRRDVTLRMRLEPVTIENGMVKFLEKSAFEIDNFDGKTRLSTNDEEFFLDYKKLKPIIDKYHQRHIQKCLDDFTNVVNEENGFNSQLKTLEDLRKPVANESEKNKDERLEKFNSLTSSLCALISSYIKEDAAHFYEKDFHFNELSSKKFFEKELKKFAEQEKDLFTKDEVELINSLTDKKATRMAQYCQTLFKNRENVYGVKKNSVAYRCIHENLFRFWGISHQVKKFCNIIGSENLSSSLSQEIESISSDLTSIEKVFSSDMYHAYLSQDGIDKLNNLISAINSKIPEHNNSLGSLTVKERKAKKLYKLNTLHKQILSDKEFVLDTISNGFELEEKVSDTIERLRELGLVGNKAQNCIKDLLASLSKFDTAQIYLDSNKLFTVSLILFNDGMKLRNMIEWRKDNRPKRKVVSIQEINTYITDDLERADVNVCDYFADLRAKEAETESILGLFDLISARYDKYEELSGAFVGARKTAFKKLLDAVVLLNRSLKCLSRSEDVIDYDGVFYELYDEYCNKLKEIDHNYNLIRNYVLQAKEKEAQFPLYFGEDAKEFLNGFTVADDGHGTRHRGYLFRKEVARLNNEVFYEYYLGIANYHQFFPRRKNSSWKVGDSDLQHLIYYQTTQDTFKKQFTSANGGSESISVSDLKLRDFTIELLNKTVGRESISFLYKKGKEELNSFSSTLKGVMEQVRINLPETYSSILKDAEFKCKDNLFAEQLIKAAHSVDRIKDFVDYKRMKKHSWEIEEDLKNMVDTCSSKSYEYVSMKDLQGAITGISVQGVTRCMHLFRISNKDLNYFNPNTTLVGKIQRDGAIRLSHGKENLHTMFFRSMMNEEECVFDIGTGKILFRRASIEKKETHKPGMLKNKNELNSKANSEFKYSLYKDKRFTRDQMTFHLSMVQNYKVASNGSKEQLNAAVREYICNTKEKFNIIGIDRGERNLLYVTLMKQDGTIIRQKSLNIIVDEQHNIRTDYHQLLKEKEDNIKKQKEDWDEIDKISYLKEGYLSQAVHDIAKMAVENKAIIVMEKLSEGFKSTRQKYLSNVYQLFEKMLVRKLSFYTDKTIDRNAPGGILNALQLVATDSVELNKPNNDVVQNGIIFYVPAWMTSKIDPVTGFANLFNLSISKLSDAREIVSKFSKIGYDYKKNEFAFSFDYQKFGITVDSVNNWTIGTHGSRIVFARNDKGYPMRKTISDLTEEFIDLFEKYDIAISSDMKDSIQNYALSNHPTVKVQDIENGNLGFFEDFFRLMRYMLQLRNSDPEASDEKEKDYIISPVIMPKGKYYLSSDYLNVDDPIEKEKAKLPVDSDANGAYNIARKGILVIEQINKQKKKIKIDEKDWLAFAQKKFKESLS